MIVSWLRTSLVLLAEAGGGGAIGQLISLWIGKKRPTLYHSGILIAAGIMGAEGIAGFSAGALTIFGMEFLKST